MQFNFTYKFLRYVISKGEFLKQINAKYGKQYVLKNVDMGDYVANVFVSDNEIKDIEYVGDDLIYYRITYKNNLRTNIPRKEVEGGTDFLQAKIIDNNLVVLETPHYNYMSFITGYGTYTDDRHVIIDFPKDKELLRTSLERIFRKEVVDVYDFTTANVSERVYNGDITYNCNGYKYKSNDKLVYKTRYYKFVYIPDKKLALILK